MIIATWNINGIKARLEVLTAWLKEANPDVVCLQEIKSIDENFPAGPIEELGYNVATHGQKGFNGVAILSKRPFDELTPRLPGDEGDEQARYLEAVISGDEGAVRVASIYLPNGNPVDTEKYPYKLSWMERLIAHAQDRLQGRRAACAGRRLQCDPAGWGLLFSRKPGLKMPSLCRKPGNASAPFWALASPTPCGR